MRVLLVVSRLGRGGTEQQVPLLAQALVESGIDARVLTLFNGPPAPDIRLDPRRMVSLGLANLLPANLIRAVLAVRRHLRDNHIEVVQGFLSEGNLVAAVAGTLSRVPSITSHRDLGIDSPRLVQLNSWADRFLATAVTANCRAAAAAAARRAHLTAERINLLPNIFVPRAPSRSRAETRAQLRLTDDHQVIIAVGNMRPVKGFDCLIDAFRMVVGEYHRTDARLLIAGEDASPGYARHLEDLAAAAGLGQQVQFLGGRDDIPDLLEASDLFVMPSRSEALSNAIIEAFAAGVPVIATAVGGSIELLENDTGVLVAPQQPRPMAEAIVSLLADRERRYQLSAAGRKAAARFTADAAIAALLPLYDSVLFG